MAKTYQINYEKNPARNLPPHVKKDEWRPTFQIFRNVTNGWTDQKNLHTNRTNKHVAICRMNKWVEIGANTYPIQAELIPPSCQYGRCTRNLNSDLSSRVGSLGPVPWGTGRLLGEGAECQTRRPAANQRSPASIICVSRKLIWP